MAQTVVARGTLVLTWHAARVPPFDLYGEQHRCRRPAVPALVSIEAALLFRLRSVLDQLINELFRMADSVFTAKGSSYLFLVITLHGPSPDRWEKCLNNRIFHATMFHRNLRCGLQEQENAGSGPGVRSGIEAAASGVQAGAGSSLAEPRESVHRVGDLLFRLRHSSRISTLYRDVRGGAHYPRGSV